MAFNSEPSPVKGEDYLGEKNSFLIESGEQLPSILHIPNRKRNSQVKKLSANSISKSFIFPIIVAAPKELMSPILRHERGELLYRNVFIVRCIFEGSPEVE